MTHLIGKFPMLRDKHRLFYKMNSLLVAVSSIAISSQYLVEGKVVIPRGSAARFECTQSDKQVFLPLHGPLEVALLSKIPDRIVIDIVPLQPAQHKMYTSGLQTVITYIMGAVFGDFYETYAGWLEDNVSDDPYKWPSNWNFARVVRNAFSHSGRISFRKKSAPPVHWHNLFYSPADNGEPILFKNLAGGDIVALMLEMNEDLDKLQSPIL